jgi:hypothetical protein
MSIHKWLKEQIEKSEEMPTHEGIPYSTLLVTMPDISIEGWQKAKTDALNWIKNNIEKDENK